MSKASIVFKKLTEVPANDPIYKKFIDLSKAEDIPFTEIPRVTSLVKSEVTPKKSLLKRYGLFGTIPIAFGLGRLSKREK